MFLISPILIVINILIIAQLKLFLKDEFGFWIGVLALFTPIIIVSIYYLSITTQTSNNLPIQNLNLNK